MTMQRHLPPTILDDERIISVIHLIESDHAARFRLSELASHVGFSPSHFHRLFLDVMGESTQEYIHRTRLEKAAWELFVNSQSILGVALNFGYSCAETFTRAFTHQFGTSPSRYRRFMRAGATHEDASFDERIRIHSHSGMSLIGMRFHYHSHSEIEQCWHHFARQLHIQGVERDTSAVGRAHDLDTVTRPGLRRYTCAIIDNDPDRLVRPPLVRHCIAKGEFVHVECEDGRKDVHHRWHALSEGWSSSRTNRMLVIDKGGIELYERHPWEHSQNKNPVKLMLRVS